MEEKERIMKKIVRAIYPEMYHASSKVHNWDELVTEDFEDMQLAFYIQMESSEKVYLKPYMEHILRECGYPLRKEALENYEDALVLETEKYEVEVSVAKGKQVFYLVWGNMNMGVALLSKAVLDKLQKMIGGDFVVIAVYTDFVAIMGFSGLVPYKKIREAITIDAGEDVLSSFMYVYNGNVLDKAEFLE